MKINLSRSPRGLGAQLTATGFHRVKKKRVFEEAASGTFSAASVFWLRVVGNSDCSESDARSKALV